MANADEVPPTDALPNQAVLPVMKTLLVEWTETSTHVAMVNVPADTDPYTLGLENRLAELVDDGFLGVQREINSITVVPNDPHAEVLINPSPHARRARQRP